MGYANSSYAGDIKDWKSITKYYFFFGRVIMTWYSKQQHIVSTSTSEAEYVAVSQGTREQVWIWPFLNELLLEDVVRKMKMLRDNETSLTLIRDPRDPNCTKHINVIYHHFCRLIEDR